MVKSGSIQDVKAVPQDKVHVWPHLLVVEFVAALACTAFTLIFSIFVNAPLLELANFNQTPNPSKAPWYFLGLQELLTMFHPMIAGVTIPGMGIIVLILAPYMDRNPSNQAREPQVRDLALHALPDVLGRAGHDRHVLPGPRVQLHLPVERRALRGPLGPHMANTTILLIAIPVLVVLAGVLLIAAGVADGIRARPSGCSHARHASAIREHEREPAEPVTVVTGRDVEAAAALERRKPSTELVATRPSAPVAWVPPDPEQLGVTRRQFLNRGIVTFFGLAIAGFSASMLAFLWPKQGGGFGSKIAIGTLADVEAKVAEGGGFAYYPEGRMWVTLYPQRGASQGEGRLRIRTRCARRDGGWDRGALPEVRAPGLSRTRVQDIAVVRVPLPRFAVQPGR